MKYVVSQSKPKSEKTYPIVLTRIKGLGYIENELKKTLLYIRDEAPIISQVCSTTVLPKLVKDTHFRNLFEVGTGRGCTDQNARGGWENNLFNNIYKDAKPHERVKYGSLNIVNDPNGVQAAAGYGDSYLVFKNVRLRTTFASQDTSANPQLACCEYYTHVLSEYSDAELTALMDVANGYIPWHDSSVISSYKEIQIHGPILLKRDVKAIVISQNPSNEVCKNAERFATINN
ncbi:hypothetical protein M0811_13107 [Anaeramoeba ignava]|uniref:Uncharacterized protein n=1 Tax=Anaeramoeba ignava TaxID=1746090 RepID=A0A9Q0L6H0_ANAIG|nr:hypothetical protein M0811_13107 [Anaeramoeba ignava]